MMRTLLLLSGLLCALSSQAQFDDSGFFTSVYLTSSDSTSFRVFFIPDSIMMVVNLSPISFYQFADWASAEGGHLATFSNSAENDQVAGILHEFFLSDSQLPLGESLGIPPTALFGLRQSRYVTTEYEPSGLWEWCTGEPLTYSFWQTGEPDNNHYSFCGANFAELTAYAYPPEPDGFQIGQWIDVAEGYRYIAEFPLEGCTDVLACNHAPYAEVDNGSCLYPWSDGPSLLDCQGECLWDPDQDGICNPIYGCMDPEACNHWELATEQPDGACVYPADCEECITYCFTIGCDVDDPYGICAFGSCSTFAECIDGDANGNGVCDCLEAPGCMDPAACNHAPLALSDDGSCDYSCCPGPGCCDDGTGWDADLQRCAILVPTDVDLDGCTGVGDVLEVLASFGECASINPSACNNATSYHYNGENYPLLEVEDQCWFKENLRTIQNNLGQPLNYITSPQGDIPGISPVAAVVDPDMNPSLASLWGRFYNQPMIEQGDICPLGWRVPTASDYFALGEATNTLNMPSPIVEAPTDSGWRILAPGCSCDDSGLWTFDEYSPIDEPCLFNPDGTSWTCQNLDTNRTGFDAQPGGLMLPYWPNPPYWNWQGAGTIAWFEHQGDGEYVPEGFYSPNFTVMNWNGISISGGAGAQAFGSVRCVKN